MEIIIIKKGCLKLVRWVLIDMLGEDWGRMWFWCGYYSKFSL